MSTLYRNPSPITNARETFSPSDAADFRGFLINMDGRDSEAARAGPDEPPRTPEPFRSYVDLATTGRTTPARLLAGTLVVVVVATLFMVGLMALGAFAIGFGWLAEPFGNEVIGNDVFSAFLGSRAFLAAAILGIAGIWAGVWLALRLIHGRRLGSVLGLGRRIAWRDFAKAAAATTLVAGIGIALNFMIDPSVRRSDMPVASWIWALPVMAAILLAQTSAEELMFRGYLPQALATRFRSPLVWAVLPALLFAVLHWQPASGPLLLAIIIGAIAVFAAAATVLTVVTGNLGAAMGMHFANNVFAFLVMSSETPAAPCRSTSPGRSTTPAGRGSRS